ncbi:MAG: M20/M25/M40 family metallo-hydrolase [Desulfobacterales bacterium]
MTDTPASTHALQPAELLQQLIRFDTTNPPGNEKPCIEFIDHMLQQAGIKTQILARDPDRPNLIARYPGEGHAPPLLMYGHVDVVTTENQEWQHPPFEGGLIDGYVWGRGALDMKGAVAMMVAALIRSASANIKPAGDIILAVLSDEEAGGRYGAKFLVEEHPEAFANVKYAIGEFGGASMYIGNKVFYPIQVAEKQACWMTATLKGPAGHASMPISGGAMAKLGRLLTQLDDISMPPHITPVTRQMVQAMAAHMSPPASMLLKQLLNPVLTGSILKILGERGRQFKPLLYNTITPTVVRGGSKINVIPSEIELQLDGRLLPGYTPADMLRELRQTIDPKIPIDILTYDPTVSEPDMTFFPYLKKILKEMDPKGHPIPMILPGVTDARFFAKLGIQTYGFTPMKLPPDFSFFGTVHSGDERIPADAVEFGTNAISRLIQTYNSP